MTLTIKDIVHAALAAAVEGLPAPTNIEPSSEIYPGDGNSLGPDALKIYAGLSWLVGGCADEWSRCYDVIKEEDIIAGRITWPMFLADLDKHFRPPYAAEDARFQLLRMRPRRRESVTSFFARFTRVRLIAQMDHEAFDPLVTEHLSRVLPGGIGMSVRMDFNSSKVSAISTTQIRLDCGIIDQAQSEAIIALTNNRKLTYNLFREMAERRSINPHLNLGRRRTEGR